MTADHLPDPATTPPEELMRHYRALLAKRAKRASREKALAGEMPGCAPVGYRNARDRGEATVEVDDELAPLVREAFRLAVEGDLSLRKMLEVLTAKGLVSRNGRPLGPSSLHAILTNPFYVGKLRYGGELIEGSHKPLVTGELFERAQEALAKRRRQ